MPANAAGFQAGHDDVFARIAGRYDLLCDLFSLGAHRLWKSHMAARMSETSAMVILDVASGTGDIPLRMLKRRRPEQFWVTDLSPAMLALAERRVPKHDGVTLSLADAESLSDFADASVDLFSISFGMKIVDRARVLSEAHRVLKPGGWFFCLEAARIPIGWIHSAYLSYMNWCLPVIAKISVGGDASAYDYLLRGIHDFPDQRTFCAEIAASGFTDVGYRDLTFGIVALHTAKKP